jgi:hypothetical protein
LPCWLPASGVALEQFLTPDRHSARRLNADAHLVTRHPQHLDRDLDIDDHPFTDFSGNNKHG